MRAWRRWIQPFWRLAAIAALLAGLFLALAAGRLAPKRQGTALRRRLLQAGARSARSLLGIAVEVAGAPPSPPFFLVANHLSYLDVVVLASLSPCVFVAKSEVRAWPLLGPIVRAFGTLFLDRERKGDLPRVLAAMERAHDAGESVAIFPEGTTSDGATLAPFRSALLALPARRRLPVWAAQLSYRTGEGDPAVAEAVCWTGDVDLLPHLARLVQLERIEARVTFVPQPIQESDRKRLAARLWEVVAAAETAAVRCPAEAARQQARRA